MAMSRLWSHLDFSQESSFWKTAVTRCFWWQISEIPKTCLSASTATGEDSLPSAEASMWTNTWPNSSKMVEPEYIQPAKGFLVLSKRCWHLSEPKFRMILWLMSKNLHLQSVYLKSRQQMRRPILNLKKCESSNAAMIDHLKAYIIIPNTRQLVVSKIVTRTKRTAVSAAKTVYQSRTIRKPPRNLDPDLTQWCRQAMLLVHL